MKALVLNSSNTPFSYQNVPDPSPKKGEAVAKILACGSGLTIQHVKSGRTKVNFPIIIGHEITAEIVECNGDCGELKVGMPVTAFFYLTCGYCKWCRINRESLCNNFRGYIGRQINGGYAEYISLPANNYIPIPQNINYKDEPLETAVICDAIATPLKVIKKARISSFDRVGVIGAGGGLGIHMIKMLHLNNINAVAFDTKSNKEKVCLTSGASIFFNPLNNNIYENIKEFTKDEYLDVVIDFSGSTTGLNTAISLCKYNGKVIAGSMYPEANSNLKLGQEFHWNNIEIISSRICNDPQKDYPAWNRTRLHDFIINLIESKKYKFTNIIKKIYPFRDALKLYKKNITNNKILKLTFKHNVK